MTNTAGGGIESIVRSSTTIGGVSGNLNGPHPRERCRYFMMPLHYPRHTKADYECMPEWKLDCLLAAYGLPVTGDSVEQKRKFAMGAFLWSN
ncbi:hypothetical protein IFM89_029804 [Coptis chinensis]|uniref:DUF7722 domain-containing protein n=1 Tax=Coptis chinensis TaxID=261450 RepID=A0A835HN48_9MAGN|nr:hypothetical protein IFM89_029804 [Coptis chinensis]